MILPGAIRLDLTIGKRQLELVGPGNKNANEGTRQMGKKYTEPLEWVIELSESENESDSRSVECEKCQFEALKTSRTTKYFQWINSTCVCLTLTF